MPTVFRDTVRSLLALAALTLICGIAFPLVVWGVGQIGLSDKAGGSLVRSNGRVVGSSLLGQDWKGEQWFHGRPSAGNYDASSSGGSNLGPNSADLAAAVKERLAAVAKENGVSAAQVPVDLVTASASGLDPDVSLQGALIQVNRVARARGLAPQRVEQLVRSHVQEQDARLPRQPPRQRPPPQCRTDRVALAMSLRARVVAAIRSRLPELDEEAAWRGALAGAASLFLLLVAIAVMVPLRDDLDTGSIALVLLLPPLVAANGGRTLSLALALLSALVFNFLFTQPYYSFTIDSRQASRRSSSTC